MQQPGSTALSDLENLYYAQTAGLGLPAQRTTIISCPKKMVGRVIGKNGETIKALQQFTGAQIQIDQRCDPTRVSIAGSPKSLQVATSMVQDIVAGTFKGFAMLRSFANQAAKAPDALSFVAQPVPVYIEGYGFVPPSQFYDPNDSATPVYQQNLHGFSPDVGSIGSPGATDRRSSLHALSLALAAQAQVLSHSSPTQPDIRATSPGFTTSPHLQTLVSNQQHAKLPQGSSLGLPSYTARSLFPSTEEQDVLRGMDRLSASPLTSSLPSLSTTTATATPTSQGNDFTVWSQLEKLSPDGAPASGSPLLTPVQTPSRASSPASKQTPGGLTHLQATSTSAALLSQLQSLTLAAEKRAPDAATAVSASSFYSSGWPTASPQQPQQQQQQTASAGLQDPQTAWISMLDPKNQRFYHNCQTGQSQYEPPDAWLASDFLAANGQHGPGGQPLPRIK